MYQSSVGFRFQIMVLWLMQIISMANGREAEVTLRFKMVFYLLGLRVHRVDMVVRKRHLRITVLFSVLQVRSHDESCHQNYFRNLEITFVSGSVHHIKAMRSFWLDIHPVPELGVRDEQHKRHNVAAWARLTASGSFCAVCVAPNNYFVGNRTG